MVLLPTRCSGVLVSLCPEVDWDVRGLPGSPGFWSTTMYVGMSKHDPHAHPRTNDATEVPALMHEKSTREGGKGERSGLPRSQQATCTTRLTSCVPSPNTVNMVVARVQDFETPEPNHRLSWMDHAEKFLGGKEQQRLEEHDLSRLHTPSCIEDATLRTMHSIWRCRRHNAASVDCWSVCVD